MEKKNMGAKYEQELDTLIVLNVFTTKYLSTHIFAQAYSQGRGYSLALLPPKIWKKIINIYI